MTCVRGVVLAGVVGAAAAGCGSGGGASPPAGSSPTVSPAPTASTTAPASAVTAVTAAPTTPTGPSLRLSDGTSVVALDPATGGVRATWPDAALSLAGTWTVAVAPAKPGGEAIASWVDPGGRVDHTGPVPDGLTPGLTSADGRWAVFVEPAPPRADGEIGPRRTSTRLVVTDGAGWTKDVTLAGNFAPDAFGAFDDKNVPQTMQLIEYLPPAHPTSYRVRTLDLPTGAVSLPSNLHDKGTPVDQTMAGTSRTQVYAAGADLLFTLYKPAPAGSGSGETWEYGFVHTLATSWGGVYCIDLPEALGMEDHDGSLALRADQRALFVVTNGGRLAEIHTDDPYTTLKVDRLAELGVSGAGRPVIAAGADHLWVAIGRDLAVVDPVSLRVLGRAELPSPVTALTFDERSGALVVADAGHLRRWSVDASGAVSESSSVALPLPPGFGPVVRIVLP